MDRNGKPLAALITPKEAKLLERLLQEQEDRMDNAAADRALADMKARGEKPIPWEEVERLLDRLKG